MRKITLYKSYNPDPHFGGYGWHIDEVWNDWDHIYSHPYEVELPKGFEIGETMAGEKTFFKSVCKQSYTLDSTKTGQPCLVGADGIIQLTVIDTVTGMEV